MSDVVAQKFIEYLDKYGYDRNFYTSHLSSKTISFLNEYFNYIVNFKYSFRVINNKLYISNDVLNRINKKYVSVVELDGVNANEVLSELLELELSIEDMENTINNFNEIKLFYRDRYYLVKNNKYMLTLSNISSVSVSNILISMQKELGDYLYNSPYPAKEIMEDVVELQKLLVIFSLGVSNNISDDFNRLKELLYLLKDMNIINSDNIVFNTGVELIAVEDIDDIDIFIKTVKKQENLKSKDYSLDILTKIEEVVDNKDILTSIISKYGDLNNYNRDDINRVLLSSYFKLNGYLIDRINYTDLYNLRDILKEIILYDRRGKITSLKEIFYSSDLYNKEVFSGTGTVNDVKSLAKILSNRISRHDFEIIDDNSLLFESKNYKFKISDSTINKLIRVMNLYSSFSYNGKDLFPVLVHKRNSNILFDLRANKNISSYDDLVKYLSDKSIAYTNRFLCSDDKSIETTIKEYVEKTSIFDSRYELNDSGINRDTSIYSQEESARIIRNKIEGTMGKNAKAFSTSIMYLDVDVDYVVSRINDIEDFYSMKSIEQLKILDDIIYDSINRYTNYNTTNMEDIVSLVLAYVLEAKYSDLSGIVLTTNCIDKNEDNKYMHLINAINNSNICLPNGKFLGNVLGTIINIKDYNGDKELIFEANTRLYDLLNMSVVLEKHDEYII